ncbi:TetR family transcriptional regulator [Herbihabitans rhizosphaerae]|uniref:TetR family transcriptional regulator n=1 Tax=Herbihabitans rhizosphaerae TaxID=1872711 RepID=A0A4V2ERF5_9PSEU|nr:TetR/AcrR family transcriptional regulator [Herbihabitans rhizosphaerae]RZS31133.1 TetR family transcriptional regulator [Herbihabitans rhizosphaerae]
MNESPAFEALPRGRHRLTREQVVESQRSRLLVAMADAVAEKGYVHTSVADVLKRARVSRETFYQNFADKEACFLASLDHSATILVGIMGGELVDNSGPPKERLDRALRAYLATLAAEPAVARAFFIDSFAAGRASQLRRFDIQEKFVQAMIANFATEPSWQTLPDPAFACRVLVGAISSLVVSTVATGKPEELPELRKPIMDLLEHFGL